MVYGAMTLIVFQDVIDNSLDSKTVARAKIKMSSQIYVSDPMRSIELMDEVIEESIKSGYHSGEAEARRMKAMTYWVLGDFDEAMKGVLKSLAIHERIADTSGMKLVLQ